MPEEPEFPPNSEASKKGPSRAGEKKVDSVVSGGVTRKKKSVRKQFQETFVAGDAKTASRSVVFDVLLPAAKDTVIDMGNAFLERLLNGEGRRRGARPPLSGSGGPIPYQNYAAGTIGRMQSGAQRALSNRARAHHDFDEIVLENRTEAENVIDQLFELVDRYGYAQVSDLYDLLGIASAHTDNKWGWTNLAGASVSRVRGGYLLDIPEPHPL